MGTALASVDKNKYNVDPGYFADEFQLANDISINLKLA